MKREIICPKCEAEAHKLFPYENPFPGEHVKFVPGTSLGTYICDHCARRIKEGDPCCAFSISADYGRNPYSPWEADYVRPL